jgi:hypothetical protein
MSKIHDRMVVIGNSQVTPGIGEQVEAIDAGAGKVIDLSNGRRARPRRGGLGPGVPQLLSSWQVTAPAMMIGHTRDFADQSEPVIVREADTVRPGPDGFAYAEGRCGDCVARPFLAGGQGQAIMVLEHEPGCPAMAALLRLAGAS